MAFFFTFKNSMYHAQKYCYFDTNLHNFRSKNAWLGVGPKFPMFFCAFRPAGPTEMSKKQY